MLDFVKSAQRTTPRAPQLAAAIVRLAQARLDHDPNEAHAAAYALGVEIMKVQAAADLFGRAAMRFKLRSIPKPLAFAAPSPRTFKVPDLLPFDESGDVQKVVPWEAILDLLERDPIFTESAEEIRVAYAQQHAFAAAKAADVTVAAKVQDVIMKSLRGGQQVRVTEPSVRPSAHRVVTVGTSESASAELVAQITGWALPYAQTVVRTNATTAYVAGQFREAMKLQAAGAIGGLRYQAVLDGDCRPNHRAAHGLVARVGDPVWELLSPPLGYNCRCSLQPVDELFTHVPEHARVPAGAHPDTGFGRGFGQRPDLSIYGGLP